MLDARTPNEVLVRIDRSEAVDQIE